MAAIGSCWATGSWLDDVWADDTWSGATIVVPPATAEGGGGAGGPSGFPSAHYISPPATRRKRPRWAGVTLHWTAVPMPTWHGTGQTTAPVQQPDTVATPTGKSRGSMGLRPVLHVQQPPAWLDDWQRLRVAPVPKRPRKRHTARVAWDASPPALPAWQAEAEVIDDEGEALNAMFQALNEYLLS